MNTNSLLDRIYQRIDNKERWRAEELEFLPAALEIQEAPPSPAGRAVVWTIVVLFSAAIVWSIIGQIDIVAVAQGRIIPSDRVKVVQPLEMGIVREIHVMDGQAVVAGEVLVTLDSTNAESDQRRLRSEYLDALFGEQRLQKFVSTIGEESALTAGLEMAAEEGANQHQEAAEKLAMQQSLLLQQVEEYQARVESLRREHDRQLAARGTALSERERAERTLPLLDERILAFEQLLEPRYVSRDMYLQVKQQHVALQQDVVTLSSRVQELDATLATIEQQTTMLNAETRRSALEELNQVTAQRVAIEQELRKAEQRNNQQQLTSPIDGTVQQLLIHTAGGVVTPAQELMLIVPLDGSIEVEAFVLNRDIGFVQEGQEAEVKLDAFNFTQYGVIEARVADISSDAIQDEVLGLVYKAKVVMNASSIRVDTRVVDLAPGMSVTVEMKTGRRRLIEYFLSPLMRFKQESVKER